MTDIGTDDLQQEVDRAERLREKHGNIDAAMQKLGLVISLAEQYGYLLVLRNALAQRIVCNKHLYRLHGAEVYIHAMVQDCLHGLTLRIEPNQKAVFHFRSAEAHALVGKNQIAQDDYQLALETVAKDSREHAEILSSHAEFLADEGKMEDATHAFQKALVIYNDLRGTISESDWLTLQSGLYARLAKSAVNGGDYVFGAHRLGKAVQLASWLCLRWGNRQRLVLLCHEIWTELNKRLSRRS